MKEIRGQEIAILSDIHGNSLALREVLKDIKRRGIKRIINLGDSLYGPLDPKGTFELLVEEDILSISGNQDRFILENLDCKSEFETLEYVKSQMNEHTISWLKSLAFDYEISDEIYACHASPQSDTIYLLEKLETHRVSIHEGEELDRILKDIQQKVVICGHSHVAKIVATDNKLIVNPGSVGLPAYDDDLPIYHKMENYNPSSNYVVMSKSDDSMKLERISLEYDFEKAARLAEANNRHDWAKWIRTGIV
jgi:putative phosphoesterase